MARIVSEGNQLSSARKWIADFLDREHVIAGGVKVDAAQFHDERAVKVVVGAAGALANATSVPVAALSGAIPDNTLLDFGGKKFARVDGDMAAAEDTLTVDAIATALVENDTAWYIPANAFKVIPSGTLLGRTYTERDAGTAFGPAADADDEVYLLVFDITDAAHMNDAELLRPGTLIKENFVPGWTAVSATLKGKIRTAYVCQRGAN